MLPSISAMSSLVMRVMVETSCYGRSVPQVSNTTAGQWTKSQGVGVTPRSNVNINSGEYMMRTTTYICTMAVAMSSERVMVSVRKISYQPMRMSMSESDINV